MASIEGVLPGFIELGVIIQAENAAYMESTGINGVLSGTLHTLTDATLYAGATLSDGLAAIEGGEISGVVHISGVIEGNDLTVLENIDGLLAGAVISGKLAIPVDAQMSGTVALAGSIQGYLAVPAGTQEARIGINGDISGSLAIASGSFTALIGTAAEIFEQLSILREGGMIATHHITCEISGNLDLFTKKAKFVGVAHVIGTLSDELSALDDTGVMLLTAPFQDRILRNIRGEVR